MTAPQKWERITDLEEPESLTDNELASLGEVWGAMKHDLEMKGVSAAFNQGLHREWAIELGIIENAYSLDRGTTEVLIERGIDADLIPRTPANSDATLTAAMIRGHQEALEGMFAFVKAERTLTTGYIKELHAALLRHQDSSVVVDAAGNTFERPLAKGAYKLQPNNPTRANGVVHEYCPPEHVASEMDCLVEWHRKRSSSTAFPEVEAAWLHHRFTQIHPFTDGNGRVARSLATIVFLKAGWFPLVITRDDRSQYIDALETADNGILRPLVDLFVRVQRRTLIQLLKVRDSVSPPATAKEAVAAAVDVLRQRKAINSFPNAYATADRLRKITEDHIRLIQSNLSQQIEVGEGINLMMSRPSIEDDLIREAANLAGYEPNLAELNVNHALRFGNPVTATIVVCFHGVGRVSHGLVVALVFLALPGEVRLAGDFFQTNYNEPPENAVNRFGPWLERNLASAMTAWTKFL
ncbi:MAG: Fic family protein [Bryobacteraceae bacterium]